MIMAVRANLSTRLVRQILLVKVFRVAYHRRRCSEMPSFAEREHAMTALAGRVAIITGSSRGIGRALALGLAADGCHIVVAAKSVEATERLPGSIYTVAKEAEQLGAQALPVQVDVRDEARVEALASKAVERFGRIDILINNAGALW